MRKTKGILSAFQLNRKPRDARVSGETLRFAKSRGRLMLIDGVMLLWFILTGLSVAFVALDIRATPEHPVMKSLL